MTFNCSTLAPNADITGPGVRTSFYVQTVSLGECGRCVDLRSPSYHSTLALLSLRTRDDEPGQADTPLWTLTLTNMAYITATLGMGFRRQPTLTLYE